MGIRYFSGGRSNNGKRSPASELMRIEIQKKGKMPAVDRYKFLLKQKLAEDRKAAMGGKTHTFSLPGAKQATRKMSVRAENALKQIAMKKAAQQAKIMRQMVIVQPKVYHNGRVTQKGGIYDVAGNKVGKINTKNGKIAFFGGFAGGKYKPRSLATELFIRDSIDKYSPYYINLRKMQAMQNGWNPETGQFGIDPNAPLYDHKPQNAQASMHAVPQLQGNVHGTHEDGHMSAGAQAGVTSWGVVSNNVWGTYNDNVWGTMVDNVWGGAESNVWGGIGGSTLGAWKGVHVWGTGNGKNYLRGITKFLSAFLGLKGPRNGSGRSGTSGGVGSSGPRMPRSFGRTGGGGAGAAPRSSGRSR